MLLNQVGCGDGLVISFLTYFDLQEKSQRKPMSHFGILGTRQGKALRIQKKKT